MDNYNTLDHIQQIINRIEPTSAVYKGFAAALVGSSLTIENITLHKTILISLLLIAFVFVDAYFLCMGRKYRKLYKKALNNPDEYKALDTSVLTQKEINEAKATISKCVFSRNSMIFYFTAIIVVIFNFIFKGAI